MPTLLIQTHSFSNTTSSLIGPMKSTGVCSTFLKQQLIELFRSHSTLRTDTTPTIPEVGSVVDEVVDEVDVASKMLLRPWITQLTASWYQ